MALPNFLVIGAAKAGTTSLYHYFAQHPDIFVSPVKEARYVRFEGPSDAEAQTHTRAAYERLFDGVTSQRAVGEVSPQYLNSPVAAERMTEDLPGVRIIASLRNPAERAYSAYLGRLRGGLERCSLDEAMRPGTYYFEASLYYPRLARYFDRFDRPRIKVILFDDLVAHTRDVVCDLYEFLGVDPAFAVDVSVRHNPAAMPRSIAINRMLMNTVRGVRRRVPMLRDTGLAARAQRRLLRRAEPLPSAIRRRLLDQFADDVARTGALIGRDLTGWLR